MRKTKYFMYALLGVFSVVVFVIHFWITVLPMTFFAWALFLPMVALTGWLVRADTVRDFHQLSQFCKAIMLAGIASMAFL